MVFAVALGVACIQDSEPPAGTGGTLTEAGVDDGSSPIGRVDASSDATVSDADVEAGLPPGACDEASGNYLRVDTFTNVHESPASSIAARQDGHVIVGSYRELSDLPIFDNGAGPLKPVGFNNTNVYLVRRRDNATVAWQRSIGGSKQDDPAITTDEAGDVYLVGTFIKPKIAGQDAEAKELDGSEDGGVLVVKFNGADGKVVWVDRFLSDGPNDGGVLPAHLNYCGAPHADGGHVVIACSMYQNYSHRYFPQAGANGKLTASSSSQSTGTAIYRLRTDNGQVDGKWTLAESNVQDVSLHGTNVLVAGTFANKLTSTDVQLALAPQGTGRNGFVVEFDASNNAVLWSRTFSAASVDGGSAPAVSRVIAHGTSSTGIVVAGKFSGTVNPGLGPITSHTNGTNLSIDTFFARFEPDGAGDPSTPKPVWQTQLGGPSGATTVNAIDVDPCGRVVFAADSTAKITTDDGIALPAPPSGRYLGIVGKLDTNGTFSWANALVSSSVDVHAYDVAVDGKNQVLAVGEFSGKVDFGSGTPKTASGNSNPYVVIFSP